MMFARAVGDPNPIYADAEYAASTDVGSIIAPPTFVQASAQFDDDYPLRPRIGEPWFGSGKTATGAVPVARSGGSPETATGGSGGGGGNGGVLHAEQHYEYHRPLRAGEVLTATVLPGKAWQKEGRRGGTLSFSESIIEYRGADGALVVTARSVGVRTGAVVKQEA
jgi:hypothetical protein